MPVFVQQTYFFKRRPKLNSRIRDSSEVLKIEVIISHVKLDFFFPLYIYTKQNKKKNEIKYRHLLKQNT